MKKALTFDDVALVPAFNNIPSRLEPNLSTWLCSGLRMDIPILAANMDTVIGEDLADVLIKYGSYPIFHRFTDLETQKKWVKKYEDKTFISAGLNDFDKVIKLLDLGAKGVCIDVAHGHDIRMLDLLNKLSNHLQTNGLSERKIIAGNVCTAGGYIDLVNAGANSVKVGIGGGCLVGDTKILMSNGSYKNIKDITPGEEVINRLGKAVKVKRLIDSGYKKVIKVKTSNWHLPTYITPDHLFYVGNLKNIPPSSNIRNSSLSKLSNQFDCIEWEEIGNIDIKNYKPLRPKQINYNLPNTKTIDIGLYFGRKTKHTKFSKNKLDIILGTKSSSIPRNLKLNNYEIGYIFGTFIGDGSSIRKGARNPSAVGWFFGENEKHFVDKLNKCMLKVFNLPLVTLYNRPNMLCVGVYNVFLAKFFECFNKRDQKHLPSEMYCKNKEYVRGILDGLIDSDGYIDKEYNVFSFSNTSIQSIELARFCCNVLNINYCSYSTAPKDTRLKDLVIKNCKPVYTITEVKNRRIFENNYIYNNFINLSLESAVYRKVWDLEIDCPTHSFIANGNIVHNSACSTRIITGYGVSQVTAIQDCVEMAKKYSVPIISDGAIKCSADIMKALAVGACSVMIGKMFALTLESAAKKKYKWKKDPTNPCKNLLSHYRGQASANFQNDFKGGLKPGTVAEGVDFWAPVTGTASELLDQLLGGIRSGFTYGGARHIDELQRKAEFVEVTPTYITESNPRKD